MRQSQKGPSLEVKKVCPLGNTHGGVGNDSPVPIPSFLIENKEGLREHRAVLSQTEAVTRAQESSPCLLEMYACWGPAGGGGVDTGCWGKTAGTVQGGVGIALGRWG